MLSAPPVVNATIQAIVLSATSNLIAQALAAYQAHVRASRLALAATLN